MAQELRKDRRQHRRIRNIENPLPTRYSSTQVNRRLIQVGRDGKTDMSNHFLTICLEAVGKGCSTHKRRFRLCSSPHQGTPPLEVMDSILQSTTQPIRNQVYRIQTDFMDELVEEMPNMASLTASSSRSWKVKVVKGEDGITLEDGWEKFRDDNNLPPGEVLLFRYSGNWKFDVEIFSPNGCSRKLEDFDEEGIADIYEECNQINPEAEQYFDRSLENLTGMMCLFDE
ncbi:hypothetical protein M9H77_28417 [Catharanthus roseus]|uniref:Uncharacterized protein n=1 Tax=Catharanthus roseus TaxID=4058 RepID=A0ACC0AHJ2_CATRO|nr:hypothetical protein M9H77_28417 [Catharanthus roseus]